MLKKWMPLGLLAWGLQSAAWAALPVQQWQSAGGAPIYLIETQNLPMLDVRIDFDAGARRDPVGKSGVAAALSNMLSKGVAAQTGQPALDENALAERWADLAAQVGIGAEQDRLSISLRSLTKPELLQPAVALLARQIAQPSLPAAVWQRERGKALAALREAQTRPDFLVEQAFTQAVYGIHPYGAVGTAQSLAQIQVADMRRLHAQTFTPCHARISMVGAVTRAQAQQIAEQLLAGLPSRCSALPDVPKVQDLKATKALRIPFAAAQTQVLLGQPAIDRASPDFFAFLVGNHILGGGGFASLLTQAVREKEGLTYSIYSSFNPGRDRGAFEIGFQTRPDQADKALSITRKVLADFVRVGPSEAELQAAKDNLLGGFAGRMDSNAKLADLLANIAWNDLPLDYLETWPQKIAALQVADIKRAFGVLQPEKMVTVIVGQP